jgi:esterase
MELHYREYGAGSPLIILHGLFGNADNWSTLARKFGERYNTFTPDLRNHGQSPHVAEMDYSAMAGDIRLFLEQQLLDSAFVMGHSMGGKVAMLMALDHPELVDKLVVVDMSVRAYSGGHQEIFDAMFGLDLAHIKTRKDAEEALALRLDQVDILQFLLKNLIYDKHLEGYKWRINLPVIYENYERILEALQSDKRFDKPALFIHGARSNYLQESDKPLILRMFPQATFLPIADAGHWVHAEKPSELFEAVINFLEA